jgi:EmrB/QacA subfamily drug resistance transporter
VESRWWTLFGLCLASFMLVVDITIVHVALPSIQVDLDADITALQWIVDAYAVTLAALILSAGALADQLGRRRMFVLGVALFSLASLACGLAPDDTTLCIARAVQGVGGAAMFATSLALIGQEFEGRERVTAIAAWSATAGIAVAMGPLVGGALTEGLSWRWVFLVNLPIGALVIAIARTRMSEQTDPDAAGIDAAGLVSFSAVLLLLVFALLRGDAEGWDSGLIVGALAGSAVLLVVFVLVERRQARPMLDLGLFRRPAFVGISVGTACLGAGMFATLLFISLYLQRLLDYSPLQAGLRFVPLSGLILVVSVASRHVAGKVAPRVLLGVGLGLTSLGLLLMHGVEVSSDWTTLLPGMLVCGLGVGIANPAIGGTALAVVSPTRSGMASGFNNTCRLAGVAIGIAVLGAVFQHGISADLHEHVAAAPDGLARTIAAAGPGTAGAAGRHAFVEGFNDILLVASGLLLVGALATLALVRSADLHRAPAAAIPARDSG